MYYALKLTYVACYLVKAPFYVMTLQDLQPLAKAVKNESALEALRFKECKAWLTVEQLIKANGKF